jgi:argininosuccinate lyase
VSVRIATVKCMRSRDLEGSPQKKNPDALELVRGKAARVNGDLTTLLGLLKGLPAGYQKDLQEDKQPVFDAADTTAASLGVMRGVVSGLELRREVMLRAAGREEMMAAGLAVALARDGMPFRKAHALVGSLVAEAQRNGESLRAIAARALRDGDGSLVEVAQQDRLALAAAGGLAGRRRGRHAGGPGLGPARPGPWPSPSEAHSSRTSRQSSERRVTAAESAS